MNRTQHLCRSIHLSVLLTIATTPALAATSYSVTPLQDLDPGSFSTDSYPVAISPAGAVVGNSFRLDSYGAVLWERGGTVRELIPGDVGESTVYDINAKGQVLLNFYGPHIWQNGVLTPLSINVSSAPLLGPLAFNDSAQVSGTGYFSAGSVYQRHAFLVSNGVTTDLGVLPGATVSGANGLNNRGDVVGYSYAPDNQSRGVLWRNGAIIDLGILPGRVASVANDINDEGLVAGSSGGRLFSWKDGVMSDLGSYSGDTFVTARAVNNSGAIIGQIGMAGSTSSSPFLWSEGVFTDIGPVLKDGRGCSAVAINDAGEIAMSCGYGRGGFRLSPTTPASDLGVVVYTGSASASQGVPLTYTIEVSNVGALAATNVQLSDAVPAGASFVSVISSQGSCSGAATVVCSLGNLASGAKATIQLTVVPTVAGALINSASVTGNEIESNTPNNSGSAGVYVYAPSADLGITMGATPNPVKRGASLSYSINIKNSGPASASGVVVTDTLPAGMSLVSVSGSQGSCSGTATVTCSLGSMVNGAAASVTIVVKPLLAGIYTNRVSVKSAAVDGNSANNSASTAVTVR